jgi:hypothetical protein
MTEVEWNQSPEPVKMLWFLRERCSASTRKLRLFGCACLRQLFTHAGADYQTEVDLCERYADRRATKKDLRTGWSQRGGRGGVSAGPPLATAGSGGVIHAETKEPKAKLHFPLRRHFSTL